MKKVSGLTLSWALAVAFTASFVAVLSLPELNLLINKEHRGFLDAVCIITIVMTLLMAVISAVTAGVLSAYNTIVSESEELEEKQ